MLLLATPDTVMQDLGYDTSMTNIASASRSALRMASASLGASLETDFSQASVTDTFYVDSPSETRDGGVRTELWLSQGFVAVLPPVAASWAESSAGLSNSLAVADVSAALLISLEKGVAVDTLNRYRRSWLRVAYTKGFPPSAEDPSLYDPEWVPDWLSEAATILAKIFLQSNPSLEDPQIKMDTKLLQTQLAGILRPHMRYAPAAVRPVLAVSSGQAVLPTATGPAAVPGRGSGFSAYGRVDP